ncbi:MAG: hypothetical protein KY462_13670 [Actinobacteria bacterium]|nr:hypothetical protein [Actinomycetota bacterium]
MGPSLWHRAIADQAGGFVIWWLIALAGVGMLMFALVADGSRVLATLNETSDVAQVAARAGARAVDPDTGLLDGVRAQAAAHAELAAAGMTGEVSADAATVTVTARRNLALPLLSLVGVDRHTVTSTRTAQALDPTATQ